MATTTVGMASSMVDPPDISSFVPPGTLELYRAPPHQWNTTPGVIGSSFVIVGSFVWAPLGLWLVWRRCKTRRSKVIFALVVVILVLYPASKSKRVNRMWVWRKFLEYFSVKEKRDRLSDKESMVVAYHIQVLAEEPLPKDKAAIYAVVPHGSFPWGLGVLAVSEVNKIFGNPVPVVATAVLRFPAFGKIVSLAAGGLKADPSSISKVLKEGTPISICPGGIAEMFWGYPEEGCKVNEEYAFLSSRKGFVRMAMKHGVPLVPVYAFGNSHLMHKAKTPWVLRSLSRLLKTSLILIWGRWGLPVPFRLPLLYAVGRPLQLLHTSNPTPEQLDEAHHLFCNALHDLFDKYKHSFGWGHKQLRIV